VTSRRATWLGWSLFALAALLALGGLSLAIARGSVSTSAAGVLMPAFGLGGVGAAIASRRPRNPLGWMFCASAIAAGLSGFSVEYGIRGLRIDPGSLPAVDAVTWVANWYWIPSLGGTGVFLFLLFPDGRLPSRRWRPVAWGGGAVIALAALAFALRPGPIQEFPEQPNPLGVEAAEGLIRTVDGLLIGLVALAVLVSAASLPARLRRARGRERQQLKWFAAAAAAVALTLAVPGPLWDVWAPARLFVFASMTGLAVAVGVAVLRYRLYDIDVVINRTLVYGALTATLAGAYVVLVLLLQLLLSPLTEESDLAIAGSTLAVAGLFRPARGRIQAVVDRRFFRSRYDAVKTLEGFGARLRDEVELDSLSAELRSVVGKTMQPAHVSLWLRGAGR
jgi:hypothetical protein